MVTTSNGNIKCEGNLSQHSWSPSLWSRNRTKLGVTSIGCECNLASFENHEYLAKERADLQHSGVAPNPHSHNSRGSYWDGEGNRWVRFCSDTGCIGTVIPQEIVESDSGPMEPLTDGARDFSVANGEPAPDYGRAFMRVRSEHDNPCLIQAGVSAVNKPLWSGSPSANSYHGFVSKNCGVLIERDSWFGRKLLRSLQSWRNSYYTEWIQRTIPMYREGHLYYHDLKQRPAKRLVPHVNARWVESNAAQTKTISQQQPRETNNSPPNTF